MNDQRRPFLKQSRFLIFICFGLLSGCHHAEQRRAKSDIASIPTYVNFNGTSYKLLRYGKPYFIKGAGGISHFEELKAAGGNSIRVWDDIDAEQIMDEAHRLGLTVMLGLWVERQHQGFDYDDQKLVEQQYQRIRNTILKYRNHPALLLWCVGNEVTYLANNIKAYDEVNRLADLIHELDPNHPVSTAIESPTERSIWLVNERCPSIDILSINNYEIKNQLGLYFNKDGWSKPYIISEYGAPAYWDVSSALWDVADEPNSQEKITFTRQFYAKNLSSRPSNCFGSYVYYWGLVDEYTHTWFSCFDEQGRATPMVGLMEELWSGRKPVNQAPVIQALKVDGRKIPHQSFVAGPSLHQASVQVNDPDNDPLTYAWEIKPCYKLKEYSQNKTLPVSSELLTNINSPTIQFQLPQKPGTYRLFVNAYDTHQHVSTANFSFEIRSRVD